MVILRSGHDHDLHGFLEVGGRLQWVPEKRAAIDLGVDLVLGLANATSTPAGEDDQGVDLQAPFCGLSALFYNADNPGFAGFSERVAYSGEGQRRSCDRSGVRPAPQINFSTRLGLSLWM